MHNKCSFPNAYSHEGARSTRDDDLCTFIQTLLYCYYDDIIGDFATIVSRLADINVIPLERVENITTAYDAIEELAECICTGCDIDVKASGFATILTELGYSYVADEISNAI